MTSRRFRQLLPLFASAGLFPPLLADDKPADINAGVSNISIGVDTQAIRTGYLEMNGRGAPESLKAPVIVTIQNQSGKASTTDISVTGPNADMASAALEKQVDGPNGQELHILVAGKKPSTAESQTFLTIEAKQDGVVKARKQVPIRVCIPTVVKTPVLFDGAANPGLVNRFLNNRTIPKAAILHPEAKLATLCLHDLPLTVLDQFGETVPEIYEGAKVMGAFGRGDFETVNRRLRKDGTWIDSPGVWQFVSEVKNVEVDPDKAFVSSFMAAPPARCDKAQYQPYAPILLEWSVGGHDLGLYRRQITLIDSGDDYKPRMRVTLDPANRDDLPEIDPAGDAAPRFRFKDANGQEVAPPTEATEPK